MALSRPRGIVGSALIAALALGAGSSVALAPEADALVSRSMLTDVQGLVIVSHVGGEFVPARTGDLIGSGDTIRTGSGAAAQITYFEGSTVRLEPQTELIVESLRTEPDGGTVIGMMQTLGRTWHVVTKLIEGSSRYEVRTPSSTASVRGTVFAVDVSVDADGPTATVTTKEGMVIHSAIDPSTAVLTEVRVMAGEESTTSATSVERVHPAAPATLREAPDRPAPQPAKTPQGLIDKAAVGMGARSADQVQIQAEPKERAKTIKTLKQRRSGGD